MLRVLGQKGMDSWTSGNFYMAVGPSVLLFRSDMWVMSPHIRRKLCRFHQQVVQKLTWRQPQCQVDRIWVYPPLVTAMLETGLEEVETYVTCSQSIVV